MAIQESSLPKQLHLQSNYTSKCLRSHTFIMRINSVYIGVSLWEELILPHDAVNLAIRKVWFRNSKIG